MIVTRGNRLLRRSGEYQANIQTIEISSRTYW
jgi:hypothetical protein